MPSTFSSVVDVAIYGDDSDNLNYAFHATRCKVDPATGRRKHSRMGVSFVINNNSTGPQKIAGTAGHTIHIPDPPEGLSEYDQRLWRLGFCLREAAKLCR